MRLNSFVKICSLSLLIFFFIWGNEAIIYSHPTTPELLPARLQQLLEGEISNSHLPTQAEQLTPSAPVTADVEQTVATIEVLQKYLNGSWDIMYRPENQGETVWVGSPAAEMYPRLDRTTNHVVYISNQDGDFEIFIRTPQGIQQLTFNTIYDTRPNISPDGQYILFESHLNGQADIYQMRLDGSQLQQLTFDPAFDGMPYWSPDGQKIAFSSNRSGGYRIYTMNRDGSNIQQLTSYPLSLYPVWSKDGQTIAFSADTNQDSWLEAWLIDIDTQQLRLAYSFGAERDLIPTDWDPTNSFIHLTEEDYILYEGNWYLENVQPYRYFPERQELAHLYSNEPAGYMDVQNTDIIPPVTTIYTLPTHHNGPLNLFWELETDSELKGYNFQYRVNEGEWQNIDVINSNQLESLVFTPTVYGKTDFRMRASDIYFNMEEWPAEPEASTTFYQWEVSGQVVDNQGTPILDWPVQASPSFLYNTEANSEAGFFDYLTSNALLTINSLPAESITDHWRDWRYIPPTNNTLTNSYFEEGLTGWQSGGTLPVITSPTFAHEGENSLLLGADCLPFCELITIPFTTTVIFDQYNTRYSILDGEGNLHILFSHYPGSQVYHTVYLKNGTWTESVILAEAQTLKLTANQQVYYVSAETNEVVIWSADEGWQEQNYNPPIGSAYMPSFIDKEGNYHTIYITTEGLNYYYVKINPAGIRSTARYLFTRTDELSQSTNFLYVSQKGEIFIAYTLRLSYSHDGSVTRYSWSDVNGQWSDWHQLAGNYQHTGIYGAIEDKLGHITLFGWSYKFGHSQSIFLEKNSEHQWHVRVEEVNHQDTISINSYIWQLTDTTHYPSEPFSWKRYSPTTGWTKPQETTLPTEMVPYFFTAKTNGQVAWFHYGYMGQLYLTLSKKAEVNQHGFVAQSITIPADMPQPTLTFMYQLELDNPDDESMAWVEMTNGVVTTTEVITTSHVDWQLKAIDMSDWVGETVTVTFHVQQAAGTPLMALRLDAITLGSSTPDVWVDVAGQLLARPGEAETFHLFYGNRSQVDAMTNTITLTLPSETTVLTTSLPAQQVGNQLIWQVDSIASTSTEIITITLLYDEGISVPQQKQFTAEITSSQPELTVSNNSVEWVATIGRLTFLPMIAR